MKKSAIWSLGILLACMGCSKSGGPEVHRVDYDVKNVSVIDQGVQSWEDRYKGIIQEATQGNSGENDIWLQYAQAQLSKVRAEEQRIRDSLANAGGVNGGAYGENWDGTGDSNNILSLKWVTVRYQSTGVDGKPIQLSELIVWPYNAVRANPQPKHLIIGCHCTITSNAERPTNFSDLSYFSDVGMLADFARSDDYLVVIPDYEGYGASYGNPHPYGNRDVIARQVIDGAKAAVAWYEENEKEMDPAWYSATVGFSQGGAVAAAVVRYYDKYVGSGLYLLGGVCGDGPHDPLATLKDYVRNGRLYMPVAAALMLKAAVDTDPDMKAVGCTYQDFVSDKFYNTGIFQWLEDKSLNTKDIHNAMLVQSCTSADGFPMMCWSETDEKFMPYTPQNLWGRKWDTDYGVAQSYCEIEECLKPGFLAYFKDGTLLGDIPEAKLKALEKTLEKNSLTYGGWSPAGKNLSVFHSTRDEIVPFCNYESLKYSWSATAFKGLPYQSGTYLHLGSGSAFYAWYVGDYVREILEHRWTGGETLITGDHF